MNWRVVICRSNPIDPDPRVEKEAATLSSAGYSITVVGWDRSALLPSSFEIDGVKGYRLKIKANFGRGIQNAPALARWQFGLLSWLVRHRNEYEIIHACDFDTLLPAIFCKLAWSKKVVYDIFDFYADHLRATPIAIKNVIRWLDNRLISLVDAVILADQSRYQQVKIARMPQSAVIVNSPPDIYTPNVASLNKTDLRIAYVGLLQVERGLIEMLQVLERNPKWSLDLAGFGGDEAQISQIAAHLDNVKLYGRVDYQEAIRLSQAADVLFATYDPKIENHRYASPNKVFEAMMLAKPVIVARHTNMDRLVDSENCGIVVNYGNINEIEDALKSLSKNPILRNQLGQNGRKAYLTSFDWKIMQTRLCELYKQVCAA